MTCDCCGKKRVTGRMFHADVLEIEPICRVCFRWSRKLGVR